MQTEIYILSSNTGSSNISSNVLKLAGRASIFRIFLQHLNVDKPGRRASHRHHMCRTANYPIAVLPASAATAISAARRIAFLER